MNRKGYGLVDEHIEQQRSLVMGNMLALRVEEILMSEFDPNWCGSGHLYQFNCITTDVENACEYLIIDRVLELRMKVPAYLLAREPFNLVGWYKKQVNEARDNLELTINGPLLEEDLLPRWPGINNMTEGKISIALNAINIQRLKDAPDVVWGTGPFGGEVVIEINGVQVPSGTYPALQRNLSTTRDFKWLIPKPVVVVVEINGHPARALIDTGLLADFMSANLAEQLNIPCIELAKPLTIQLAVQGSRSKVNYGTKVLLHYQQVNSECYFDIINLQNYNLILGTPFLFQHQVMVGLNESHVVIGSCNPLPIKGTQVQVLESRAAEVLDEQIDTVRKQLYELASPLCAKASETDLPPLRAINHQIPLVDPEKVYPWQPLRCPEALRPQWVEKQRAYLRTRCWKIMSNGNTVPMLFIKKPGSDKLQTVVDLREQNKHTHKMSAPLPDIDEILRWVSKGKYQSIIDEQDAYEQIRIIPEHSEHSTVTMPDRNIMSTIIQIRDCNAPSTYQALMNYLFGNYIGWWMDVYLDDIVIYSDTLEDHVEHIKTVLEIL